MLVELDEDEVDVLVEALEHFLLDAPEADDVAVLYDRLTYVKERMARA